MARNTRTATIKVDADVRKAVKGMNEVAQKVTEAEKHMLRWGESSEKVMRQMDKAGQASAGATKGIIEGLGGANEAAMGLVRGFGAITGAAGLAAVAIVKAAGAVHDIAKESLRTQAVFGNLKFSIDGARTASLGLVDDMTLAQSQLTALELGAVSSVQQFEQLVEAGSIMGLVMGGDAAEGVDKLTTALARGSSLRLDDLGVTLSASESHAEYARRLGVTVDQLTDAQKAEAFRTIGLERALAAARAKNIEDGLALDTVRLGVKAQNEWTGAIGGTVSQEAQLRTIMQKLGPEIQHVNILNRRQGADLRKVEKLALLAGTSIEELGGRQALQAKFTAEANRQLREQAKAAEDAARSQEELNRQLANREALAEINSDVAAMEFELELARAEGTISAQEAADAEISIANARLEAADRALMDADATKMQADEYKKLQDAVEGAAGALQLAEARGRGARRRRGGGSRGRKKDPLADLFKKRGDEGATDDLLKFWQAEADAQLEAMEAMAELRASTLEREKEKEEAAFELRMGRLQRELEWREAHGMDTEGQKRNIAELTEAHLLAAGDVNAAEAAAHAERIRRFEEERKEREKLEKTVESYTRTSINALAASTEAAFTAKDNKGKAFAAELGEFAGSRAKMLGIEAATHFALAAIWAAALNPVKATAELTAAGIAAAKASALGATAAALGAVSGGAGGVSIPGGGGGGFAAPSVNPSNRPTSANGAPVSPLEQNGQPVPAANGGGGKVVNIHVAGSVVDGAQLQELINDSNTMSGKLRGGMG